MPEPDAHARPWRSVLYLPASNAKALEKARGLAADAIIFDLEDAVAADQKAAARVALVGALLAGGYGQRAKIVRINGLETEWGRADAAAFATSQPDAILVPKVDRPADIDAVAALVPGTPIWAMMETPAGVLREQCALGNGQQRVMRLIVFGLFKKGLVRGNKRQTKRISQ